MRVLLTVDFSQDIYFAVFHAFCFLCVWKHGGLYASNIHNIIIKSVFSIQIHGVKFHYSAFPPELGKTFLPATRGTKPDPASLTIPEKLDFWQRRSSITQAPNRKISRELLQDNQWCPLWLCGNELHFLMYVLGNPGKRRKDN